MDESLESQYRYDAEFWADRMMVDIGNEIGRMMKQRGMSMVRLGLELRRSKRYIQNILRGKRTTTILELAQIGVVLGCWWDGGKLVPMGQRRNDNTLDMSLKKLDDAVQANITYNSHVQNCDACYEYVTTHPMDGTWNLPCSTGAMLWADLCQMMGLTDSVKPRTNE